MVITWLVNSMEIKISQTFLFYGTIEEIWKVVKQTYSDIENTVEQFELREKFNRAEARRCGHHPVLQ